jgi:hypothetical protein
VGSSTRLQKAGELQSPPSLIESGYRSDRAHAGNGVGNGAPAARTHATTKADPYTSLRKALSTLFAIRHKLSDKSSTVGRIHADAEVRIAISELILAEKTVKPAPAAAPAPAPARTAPFSFTTKPVQ